MSVWLIKETNRASAFVNLGKQTKKREQIENGLASVFARLIGKGRMVSRPWYRFYVVSGLILGACVFSRT